MLCMMFNWKVADVICICKPVVVVPVVLIICAAGGVLVYLDLRSESLSADAVKVMETIKNINK